MADLELIPKLPVLAVQAGIFLVNLGIVKKLYVEPFLKVRDQRQRLTVGSKDDATRFLAEAESISLEVNERLNAAMDAAKKEREAIRAEAMAKRQKLIDTAAAEASAQAEAIEKVIRQELATERAKAPQIVAALTDEVYKIALA